MSRIAEILNKLSTKDSGVRLLFYERLGFNLTICIRSIWANPNTTDAEKIEAMKTINELSHRVFQWMWQLRKADKELIDADCFSTIRSYAQTNNDAARELGAVLNLNYREIDEQ